MLDPMIEDLVSGCLENNNKFGQSAAQEVIKQSQGTWVCEEYIDLDDQFVNGQKTKGRNKDCFGVRRLGGDPQSLVLQPHNYSVYR